MDVQHCDQGSPAGALWPKRVPELDTVMIGMRTGASCPGCCFTELDPAREWANPRQVSAGALAGVAQALDGPPLIDESPDELQDFVAP